MNSRIELSDDGDRIEIYIDANFKRKSGRKRILAPDGRPVNPDRNPLADQALLTALIRAIAGSTKGGSRASRRSPNTRGSPAPPMPHGSCG